MKVKKIGNRLSLFFGDQNKRLNWDHPQCKIPSMKRCLKCITNLFAINQSDEFDGLSSEDKCRFYKDTNHDMNMISILFDQNLKEFYRESYSYEKEILLTESSAKTETTNSADDQVIINYPIVKKIRLTCTVKAFGQKTGFYYFNKKNIYGLQLPVSQIKHITAGLCLLYEGPHGDILTERYLEENINFGSKCDPQDLLT